MNASPLVSIAMATYNGENYVGKQLRSIIHQSYSNLEIIITDDASTDGTLAMLEYIQKENDFIKIYSNPVNLGITSTFEQSIKNCKGHFIAIADQDDIWELNKIEVLVSAMENEDVIFSDSELVDKSGRSLNKRISSFVNLKSFYSGTPFLTGICLPGHTLFMRADFVRSILPMPKSIMYDRWISFCAAANNGIKYIDRPLVKYRQHETNSFGVGKVQNKKNRKTNKQKFYDKLLELKAFEKAAIKDDETKKNLNELLTLFTRKPSAARSLFFFKNRNKLLVIKKKNRIRKILYCLKMYFKANY
jgi:glycosyltransferase involved in cell wall biosynthesis